MLSVIMLSVIMLGVIMLVVVAPHQDAAEEGKLLFSPRDQLEEGLY